MLNANHSQQIIQNINNAILYNLNKLFRYCQRRALFYLGARTAAAGPATFVARTGPFRS